MMATKIEWTEETWNPIAGCTKCSPGCDNCYAERMAYRLACMGIEKYEKVSGRDWAKKNREDEVYCDEKSLNIPLHWRKPRRIFVCSMSDLFHPKVPYSFIDKIFAQIAGCEQHTFQILTKRPKQMHRWYNAGPGGGIASCATLPNLWLGVTVCTPDEKPKIDILRDIPAAVKFLSFEPLLADMGEINLDGIDWVIVGGESGPNARPMHPDWVRGIRDQCVAAGVPFFFKQWGKYTSDGPGKCVENDVVFLKDGTLMNVKDVIKNGWQKYYGTPTDCVWMKRVGKKKAGSLLDGREWKQYPLIAKENQ